MTWFCYKFGLLLALKVKGGFSECRKLLTMRQKTFGVRQQRDPWRLSLTSNPGWWKSVIVARPSSSRDHASATYVGLFAPSVGQASLQPEIGCGRFGAGYVTSSFTTPSA